MNGSNLQFNEFQQQRMILLLEYFGSPFAGSQFQLNAMTVQETLQNALDALQIPHGPLIFSGRTDAGVHAKGQMVHFDTPENALRQIPDFIRALNAVLPDSIAVQDYRITTDMDFHATRSAQWRWYQYKIFNRPNRSVWMPTDCTLVRRPLNVDRMAEGAAYYKGLQDFESFKCAHTHVQNNICHVIHSQIQKEGDLITFDIVANRFIYKMVRNLMGVLIEIGLDEGTLLPNDIPQILEQQDRQAAGKTARPEGLSLMAVDYPEPWGFFQNNVYVTRLKQIIQESSCDEKNILRKAS